MGIEKCTVKDYHQILTDITDFWGNDRTLSLHHPIFVHEFGNSAYVIKVDTIVIAYLFGFISQVTPTAYVHLIGIHKDYQHKGLGTDLYNHFIAYAREKGCIKLKAITTPANNSSIAFHKKIGMTLSGNKNINGIEVVPDYSGPGQDRVVFEMDI